MRIVRHSEDTFNILVLHQNRLKHAEARYIPETFLNFRDAGDVPFFNLVLWGHEHECKQNVERAAGNSYYILQPGSSVATSLCAGEAVEKRVFVVTVSGKKFNCRPQKLMTVRPMIYKNVREKLRSFYPAFSVFTYPKHSIFDYCSGYQKKIEERAV